MKPFLGGLQVGPIRSDGDGTAGELESKSELQAGSSSSSSSKQNKVRKKERKEERTKKNKKGKKE